MKANQYVNDLTNFDSKVTVVTGALGQIGRTIAEGFKSCGAIVAGIDSKPNDETIGYFDTVLEVDVSSRSALKESMEKIEADYGTPDILINNAGIAVFDPFYKRTNDDLDSVFDVNIKGVFNCIVEFAAVVKSKNATGAVVNISSLYGVVSPDPRIYVDLSRNSSEIYGATKAGVIQMTKYFAVHLAQNRIRVNAISPGGIFNPAQPQGEKFIEAYSDRCPMGRMGMASELVGGILFLASPASSYVNGHNLIIDGGFTAW